MANKLNLTKSEKKVLSIWGIILLIIVLVLFIINIFFPLDSLVSQMVGNKKDTVMTGEVKDFSRYLTVTSTIDKFYAYINADNEDAVVKILNEQYIKDNNITASNVNKYIKFDAKQLAFDANIMYLVYGKKGVYEYYVDGNIIYANTGDIIEKAYYSVILDGNTLLFNIRPITENEYSKGAK